MQRSGLACAAFAVVLAGPVHAATQELVIHAFAGQFDGASPNSGLTLAANGFVYGTTQNGGGAGTCANGCGTVFQLNGAGSAWNETMLYAFKGGTDGQQPYDAAMAEGPDGALYGDTLLGGQYGNGTVFKLVPSGGTAIETVLHAFAGGTDGAQPQSSILLGSDGKLYGTTSAGGTSGCGGGGCGTVYSLTPPLAGKKVWKHTVVYKFRGGKDGAAPTGGLVLNGDGVLYGTTTAGGGKGCGGAGCGTVFSLTPGSGGGAWSEAVLLRFKNKSGGLYAFNGLYIDGAGDLYGSTSYGGKGNCGVAPLTGCGTDFELSPPLPGSNVWQQTVIHTFFGKKPGGLYDGAYPNGAFIAGAGGELYGSTYGGGRPCPVCAGTIYKLTPPTGGATDWAETILYAFQAGADGSGPQGGLVATSSGQLLGVTANGGSANLGTAFVITP